MRVCVCPSAGVYDTHSQIMDSASEVSEAGSRGGVSEVGSRLSALSAVSSGLGRFITMPIRKLADIAAAAKMRSALSSKAGSHAGTVY